MNKDASATLSLLESPPKAGAGTPCLYLMLEAGRPRAGSMRLPLHGVDELQVGRGEARVWSEHRHEGAEHRHLEVPDAHLSSAHFRLTRLGTSLLVEDVESKNGTLLNGKPAQREILQDGDLLQAGETFFLYREGALPAGSRKPVELGEVAESGALSTIVPGYARELERIRAIAPSDVTVLLHGEMGSGKELVARALHALSGREGPFVAVNCGALPDTLVESELFGYRKGAFSGAVEDRPGLVRSAGKGTLFLDEIGDLPLAPQAALLRVLQEHEVRPVGSTTTIAVDARFVCATHRDLAAMVDQGSFRADLLARLAGFVVELPPLRERREDLGVIVATLLARLAPSRSGLRFTAAATAALLGHGWAGNVRELEQSLARALALAEHEGRIDLEHLDLRAGPLKAEARPRPLSGADEKLREELLRSLDAAGGNVSEVARQLGKDRKQIRRWIERFGIGRRRS